MADVERSAILKATARVMHDMIADAIEPLQAKIAELEARPFPEKGEPGERGLQGFPGEPGAPGSDGTDGKDGAPGRDGGPGKDGRDGIDGKDGADGINGADGAPGLDGEPGKDGRDGVDGKDGADGKDGVDGEPADMDLVQEFVDGAVEKAVGELPLQPLQWTVNGDGELVAMFADGTTREIGIVKGRDGERGASVMDGKFDGDGALLLRLSDGRIVNCGVGRGEPGKDGEPGATGRAGRDAHELQILPGIDESRSYTSGVVARWRGGLIRAERETSPVVDGDIIAAGWSVILEGIADEFETIDGRMIVRTTVYTGGRRFNREFKHVMPVYVGVWKDGEFYDEGDCVTFAGSMFIAQTDTTAKPEDGQDWKLCVKRGRDARSR